VNNTEHERIDAEPGQNGPVSRDLLAAQQRTGEATAELLGLFQTATEDGRLLGQDILALEDWLNCYQDAELPDGDAVRGLVRRVVAVGSISDGARRELYQALDKVLPRDVAAMLRSNRRTPALALHVGGRPIETQDFVVAATLYEERAMSIARYAFEGDEVMLVRDYEYPHSENAIMVRLLSGFDIGYIPEAAAKSLAPHLDEDRRYAAHIKRILNRDGVPVAIVVADIFDEESQLEALRRPSDQSKVSLSFATPKTPAHGVPRQERPRRIGFLLLVLVVALVALVISNL
jgi:HIRAN domain-containing protein